MVNYFARLIDRIKTVCEAVNLTNLHCILDFFCEFSEQSPCVLSRSLLQTTFLVDKKKVFGIHLMQDMVKDALRSFVSPPVLSPKCCLYNNHQAKAHIFPLPSLWSREACLGALQLYPAVCSLELQTRVCCLISPSLPIQIKAPEEKGWLSP